MNGDVDANEGLGRPMLIAEGIQVAFGGVTAVSHASLRLMEGTCHGLVGPNGAGKTTLLNALSGLVSIRAGEIWLDATRIDNRRPRRRRRAGLARTFQQPALVGDLSVTDNVKVGVYPLERWSAWRDILGISLISPGERRTASAASDALDLVGFPTRRRDVRATELSHGEQKIVDLARALAGQPRVILLDEPTAGLTESEMDAFAAVLACQQRDHGATLLVVSHHVHFLSGLADIATVMESGHILAEGSLEQLSRRPDVVSAFLGEDDASS